MYNVLWVAWRFLGGMTSRLREWGRPYSSGSQEGQAQGKKKELKFQKGTILLYTPNVVQKLPQNKFFHIKFPVAFFPLYYLCLFDPKVVF